ncbi:lysophospholipid acyltransferase family protein [Albibacterium bauzanense]|uniref:KDO2-lipid IV(A) lauroyltransferase n=1 Tax=Albibacterium bauzanense TaxID=653929 RepID=A0A4R1M7C0_9SPHI|nr:lysophospholipid acyltransferase family protein [Albibacterium bauzanense]TCK85593.1 KDO2-lipid IV(A) lauroyltransferase [Albibacterium bauzanense]
MNIKSKALSTVIYLISILPFGALYVLSDIIYFLLRRIIKYRKKVITENLQHAFPDKSIKEREEIKNKFYHFLADLLIENLKMRSMSAAQSKKRLKLLNPEIPLDYLNKGQSIIIVTGHYANWEWGIHSLSLMTDYPSLIIYKPINDPVFGDIYNKMRSRFGAIMVPMKQTLRKITEYKGRTHSSVFLADQTPTRKESNYFIPFLNQQTSVFKGIEKIAKKTNNPVIYCRIDRIKRGYYTAKFTILAEDPARFLENEITNIHTKFLENIIREKPELWLWSHKRWKHKPHD